MHTKIDQQNLKNALFDLLTETFETHHGIYLDRGTSVFETLETISAAEASRPVGGKCASLAAQVAHVNFYLEVIERYLLTRESQEVDWDEIWRSVERVSPEEWAGLQRQLQQTYERICEMLGELETWDDEEIISSALALVVHSAYHLGEMRQALCTLKPR